MNRRLLDSSADLIACPVDLKASHGLYNSFPIVLRLLPEIHRKLAALPTGIVTDQQVQFDGFQAFSTYLHETIHWWQRVGSTIGLMLSLSFLKNVDHAEALEENLLELAVAVGRAGRAGGRISRVSTSLAGAALCRTRACLLSGTNLDTLEARLCGLSAKDRDRERSSVVRGIPLLCSVRNPTHSGSIRSPYPVLLMVFPASGVSCQHAHCRQSGLVLPPSSVATLPQKDASRPH